MNIWKRGKYFNMWSIVHFSSGVLLGGASYGLGLKFLWAAIISIALILVWEVIEWIIGIIEPSPDVFTDIVLGLVGFSLAAFYYYYLNKEFNLTALVTLFTLTLGLALWGLIHHLSKK